MDTANGAYAEGSLRTGRIDSDFGRPNLRDSQGRKAKHDAKSAYHGAPLGGGHVWNLNDTRSFDLYGKIFWTRSEGDNMSESSTERPRRRNSRATQGLPNRD
ncbi:MAG: hypothetical protein LBI87_02475 [Candidatus Accumulibacter sp.]|jgi:hypothetical protein|nr:hypothetical protein [Accumulibacter sp.]